MSYVRKKRRSAAPGIIVFLIAMGAFLLLSTTVFFNVERVNVTGSSIYPETDIIEASGIKAGDNLVRTNPEKCGKQIESRLVYIEKAEITRNFPNTVTINVEASVPAANFICDDCTLLISKGGKVLDRISEAKAGLLNFVGTSPSPDLIPGSQFASEDEHKDDAIKQLMDYFDENGGDRITKIDVTNRSELCYTYDGRITVKLGSANDIDYKMKFSKEIITTKIGERTEGVLTILSDSTGASFLDKETLENNARIYSDNMAKRQEEETRSEETEEKRSETEHGGASSTVQME